MSKTFTLFFFLTIFGVYVYSLSPSVPSQADAGELITVAKTLGIAHPPGYPLYTILGHLFTYIPFNSIAWRINLLSAGCHTLVLVLLYKTVLYLTKNRVTSYFSVALLAFSRLFWLYSLVAEVFPLNNLFIILLIYLILTNRSIYLITFVFSLALTNHLTVVLLIPAMIFWFWKDRKKILNIKTLFVSASIFFVGLMPYLYFILRSGEVLPVVWSFITDFKSLMAFITRSDYGIFSPVAGYDPAMATVNQKIDQVLNLFRFMLDDFNLIGFIVIFTSLITSFIEKSTRRIYMFIFIIALFIGPLFLSYANFPLRASLTGVMVTERFYLALEVVAIIYTGTLFKKILEKIVNYPILRFLPYPALFLFIIFEIGANYSLVSQRDNYLNVNFGRNIFQNVPKGSIIFLSGDTPTFAAYYAKYIEGCGKNVDIITFNQFTEKNKLRYLVTNRKDLNLSWPKVSSPSGFVEANYNKVPIFTVSLPDFSVSDYVALPYGLLFRFYKKEEVPEFEAWLGSNTLSLESYELPTVTTSDNYLTIGDNVVLDNYAWMYLYLGKNCLANNDYQCAEKFIIDGLKISPNIVQLSYALSEVYSKTGRCDDAKNIFLEFLRYEPRFHSIYDDLINLANNCYKDPKMASDLEKEKNALINQEKPLDKF